MSIGVNPQTIPQTEDQKRTQSLYEEKLDNIELCDVSYKNLKHMVVEGKNLSHFTAELERAIWLLAHYAEQYKKNVLFIKDGIKVVNEYWQEYSYKITQMNAEIDRLKMQLQQNKPELSEDKLKEFMVDRAVKFYNCMNQGDIFDTSAYFELMVKSIIRNDGLKTKTFSMIHQPHDPLEDVAKDISEQIQDKIPSFEFGEKTTPYDLLLFVLKTAKFHTTREYQYSLSDTFKKSEFMQECENRKIDRKYGSIFEAI